MKLYRQKTQQVFLAFRWSGCLEDSPEWIGDAFRDGRVTLDPKERGWKANVLTPYGWMRVSKGDWVLSRNSGEMIVYSDEEFTNEYEPAE